MSSLIEYKCGTCAPDTKDKTCEECTGDASDGCNKPKEEGVDFKCYSFTHNGTAFVKAEKVVECKRLKATKISCNA